MRWHHQKCGRAHHSSWLAGSKGMVTMCGQRQKGKEKAQGKVGRQAGKGGRMSQQSNNVPWQQTTTPSMEGKEQDLKMENKIERGSSV